MKNCELVVNILHINGEYILVNVFRTVTKLEVLRFYLIVEDWEVNELEKIIELIKNIVMNSNFAIINSRYTSNLYKSFEECIRYLCKLKINESGKEPMLFVEDYVNISEE
jgi:hypothetical protein